MTVTIGSFSCDFLTLQPFGYTGDIEAGLSARSFSISGLLTPEQEGQLFSQYDTWRNNRIQDADPLKSESVGTTINLSASTDSISISNVGCWFTSAPVSVQTGVWKTVTVELVDAGQRLQALLRERERSRQQDEAAEPDFGTVNIGGVTLTLTRPMETYQDSPQVSTLSTGQHYLTGPLVATRVRDIEGYTTEAGFQSIRSWYETVITGTPFAGTWFPVDPPSASGEVIVENGANITRYIVSLRQVEIR